MKIFMTSSIDNMTSSMDDMTSSILNMMFQRIMTSSLNFLSFITSFSGLLRLLNFLHFCYHAPGRPDRFHHLLQDVTRSCCEKVLLKKFSKIFKMSILIIYSSKRLDTNQTYFYSSNFQRVKLWAHIISVLYLLKNVFGFMTSSSLFPDMTS